ncbi:venom allergen-1-like [Rhipicephalus microplus]|uniref:venom allergen-1-like n=1 Tax=Rhipicephalus microplus TaxID=6941 RepID=UPI003F6B86EB
MCNTTMDPDLLAVAESCVERFASHMKNPQARGFIEEGQNLCMQTEPGSGNDTGGQVCVAAWFSEPTDCTKRTTKSYRNTIDRDEPSCEHFTQLVWSRSQHVGCSFELLECIKGVMRATCTPVTTTSRASLRARPST